MKICIILSSSILLLFLSSCSSTIVLSNDIPMQVSLNMNDIILGEILTAELPYNPRYLMLKEELLGNALKDTGYDFIFLPQYEIINDSKIRVKGYGAKIKNTSEE